MYSGFLDFLFSGHRFPIVNSLGILTISPTTTIRDFARYRITKQRTFLESDGGGEPPLGFQEGLLFGDSVYDKNGAESR